MTQKLLLATPDAAGILVPYLKQLLPVLNTFVQCRVHIEDSIHFAQQRTPPLGDLVHQTLQLIVRFGGRDAYAAIKQMVPTFESCS